MKIPEGKKNFVIIDGYGFVFRAFFSLKDLKTPEGLPIGAVFGFINMILRLRSAFHIDYLAIALDSGKKSFRNDLYQEYKANRPEAPEELKPQFAIIREAIEAFNIPFIEHAGYEADDIIATYAKKAASEGYYVTVVSSDKDLMQLVKDGEVTLYDPIKTKPIYEADVKQKYGVFAQQIPDFLGICGDSSDNIPGVEGIGEKGAAELLEQYKNLEDIYQNLAHITKARLKNALEKHKETAFLSKKLAMLKDDLSDIPAVESLKRRIYEEPTLIAFLKKYKLNSILAKLMPHEASQASLFEAEVKADLPPANHDEVLVKDEAELSEILKKIRVEGMIKIASLESGIELQTANKKYILPY